MFLLLGNKAIITHKSLKIDEELMSTAGAFSLDQVSPGLSSVVN